MENTIFNIASAACVRGPIYEIREKFWDAGFPDHQLPNDEGWMPTEPFSGHVLGGGAIRDKLGAMVAERTGRDGPYTTQQKRNFLREAKVYERCNWPVMSIPAIDCPTLEAAADYLATSRQRRNMRSWKINFYGSPKKKG